MEKIYYTKNDSHPEDFIYKTKTFINELQKVQDTYFDSLIESINLNSKYKDYLFDYIFNTHENSYDDF